MNAKIKSFVDGATRMANRAKFTIKQHSPEILLVTGIVGMVGGTVLACRATLKVEDILEDKNTTIKNIHDLADDPDQGNYTEEDAQRDLTNIYIRTAAQVALIYAPAASVMFASAACLVQSNNIMRKRNLALAAACATVEKTLKDYRKNVVERFGEETDHELRYNIKEKTFEKDVLDEHGTPTGEKVTETVKVADPDMPSDYARFFDESCFGWEKDAEFNLMYLKGQQQLANNKLMTRGYLFLNEVYRELGIPETVAGQTVGWIYDKDNPTGDNYVDFGIYNVNREKSRDFVNGYERSILLDFNVDGDILTPMQKRHSMAKI